MRKLLGILIVTAASLLASVPGARAEGERVVNKQYVGAPTSAGLVFCGAPQPVVDGSGRSCFNVGPAESEVSLAITDASGEAIAGTVIFFGKVTGNLEKADELGRSTFCGAASGVAIPAGTTHLDVEVGDRVGAGQPCGRFTLGTIGYVTARIS